MTESIVFRFVNMLSMSMKGSVVQTSALALSFSGSAQTLYVWMSILWILKREKLRWGRLGNFPSNL